MKLLLEVDVNDKIAEAYKQFTSESKEQVNRYISHVLQKTAKKARITALKKTVKELQKEPGCPINPEILYLLFQDGDD